MKDKEFQL